MRKAAAVAVIGALTALPFLLPGEPAKPKREVPSARQVVGYINHQRRARGLTPLSSSPRLTRASRVWSVHLRALGLFEHARLTLTGGFSWIAETLYRGPAGPVGPWLRSPPHRQILLDPRARLLGIGRSGNVYVGRFARAR